MRRDSNNFLSLPTHASRGAVLTMIICIALSAAFAWLSYSAVLTKSATLDEPLHAVSAYAALRLHDYRLDPENPPLWKYWAALAISREAMPLKADNPAWSVCLRPDTGQVFTTRLLYQTPGVDGEAIVNAARGMMVILSAITLLACCGMAYRLAGSAAAIATGLLLALDPTFLAHGAIVKNDVVMMPMLLLLVVFLWRATGKLSILNGLGIAAACGLAMSMKFSGLLWPMIAAAVLLARVIIPRPWPWSLAGSWPRSSLQLTNPWTRLAGVIACGILIALVSAAIIWASYGFQFGVAPGRSAHIDIPQIVSDIRRMSVTSSLGREPTQAELDQWSPPINVRFALFLDHHRLLPEPWDAGFLGVFREMLRLPNYLLGQIREGRGWRYYFPLALLFKCPLTTMIAILACGLLLLAARVPLSDDVRRAMLILAAAMVIYMISAMLQPIDHGVRHLLPVLALAYIAAGVVYGRLLLRQKRRKLMVGIGVIFAAALAAEVLPAFPDFIPFFNVASGGARGGLALLGDSNLDWGQDLPLLARWQAQHPNEKLYFCYYGTVDPQFYGIRYHNIAGGFFLGPPGEPFTTPGVIAMSATRLQGMFLPADLAQSYRRLRQWPVRAVLGGSVYLYDYPRSSGR